ncbi:MAG: UDP-glucose 4-epimerase [Cyanobium sp.]
MFNLGTGQGRSVQQVLAAAESVTGRPVPCQRAPRRAGDPPLLVACAEKARRELGWQPRYPELATVLQHAWAWQQSKPHD